MFAIQAIATVIIKTRVAATGYHFGGAVKVVIPKIDCIKFINADFNLFGVTHCYQTQREENKCQRIETSNCLSLYCCLQIERLSLALASRFQLYETYSQGLANSVVAPGD